MSGHQREGTAGEAPVVGILSVGEMGGAIGALLARHGCRVVTHLAGRSERTRGLAESAGIADIGSDAALVDACDVVLSVVVPDAAEALADRLAAALAATDRPPVVADLNAIAPATSRAIGERITAAGAVFVDGGIIGPPPVPDSGATRIYVSGPEVGAATALARYGLDVRAAGAGVGDASALKMCYAALTKGSAALMIQLLVTAERLGVRAALDAEFGLSQPEQRRRMAQLVPGAVPKAFRWAGEMREIARTFEAVDVTGLGFEGAARTYDEVAATALGRRRVEEFRALGLELDAVVRQLAGDDD